MSKVVAMTGRTLGSTGVQVTPLSLGGHEYLPDGRSRGFNEDLRLAVTPGWIGQGFGGRRRSSVVEAATAAGINFFDATIDSEKQALARNLREHPPCYPIFVQARPEGMCYSYDPQNRRMTDYSELRAEILRGLRLLDRKRLDFLNIGILQSALDNDPEFGLKMKRNLDALKDEQLVRFAVADTFSGERTYMEMLRWGAFDAINVDLNFGDAGALERVLPLARSSGLGIIVREAFFKGDVFNIAEEAGLRDRRAVASVALKWVLQQDVDTIIVGVDTAEQLEQHLATFGAPEMSTEEEAMLASITATVAFREFEERKHAEFFSASSP